MLVIVLLAAAICFLVYSFFLPDRENAMLQITVDGEIYGTYSLDRDQEIAINDTNTCVIEDGRVWMTYSSCPDHLCESQPRIDARGGTIVCLPNRVVLSITGNTAEDAIDATT